MRDTLFPRWQGAFLAIFLLADGLYLPATPEAVQALALGTVLAVLLCYGWLRCLAALDMRDFDSLCRGRLPKWLTLILRILIAAACIAGIGQSLWRLAHFWKLTSFPGIPLWLGAAILLTVGWRIGRRGRTAIAMWSYPTFVFCGAVIALSLVITIPDCAPEHLPALVQGFAFSPPILRQFAWVILPLLFCAQGKQMPAARACTAGVLAGGLGLCLIALRAWLVLGAGAAKLNYPAFWAAGVFSVGDFLQRGEVIFGCVLALCETARVALLVCLLLWCWRYGKQDAQKGRRNTFFAQS